MRGYLLIATAAFFWGASATLGKLAFTGLLAERAGEATLGPLILAQSRTSIAVLLLVPALFFLRGYSTIRLRPIEIVRCMVMGTVGLAASNFLYYYAIDKTSVATAIILQYTAPIWVLFYMVARGRQRATLKRAGSVFLVVVGAFLAVGVLQFGAVGHLVSLAGLRFDLLGVLATLAAALSFAFYNVYGSSLVNRHERWTVVVYAMAGAALFWLLVNPPWKVVAAHYSGRQWIFLGVFSLVSMLLPFSCYFAGLQYLDPTKAIVTSCLEPVFAILFAIVFVHEQPSWTQAFGMSIVLLGTIVVQLAENKD